VRGGLKQKGRRRKRGGEMKVLKIQIKNVLGLQALEIDKPGPWTEISGGNGTGKTSCLDAIRAALGQGSDATLLKQGATEGEVVLLLDDGTEIRKRITEDKSETQVVNPEFGKISKPATYLKKLADTLSLNPIQFLTAPPKDRVNLLLQAIPMTITADKLGFVPQIALAGIDLDKHALEVIGSIGKAIYDLRTGVNRSQKDKEATARQMTETLPADAPSGNWSEVYQQKSTELSELRTNAQSRAAGIKRDAADAEKAQDKLFDAKKQQLNKELAEAIEKLKLDTEIALERASKKCSSVVAQIQTDRDAAMEAAKAEYDPKNQALIAEISQAKTMIDQHAKAESTREFIGTLTMGASALEAESAKLTSALSRLEILKASLLEKLPIGGLAIVDGDIQLDGIPYDRVNLSRRVRCSIEIAILRAGNLPLICVDGMESLDEKTFAAFKKETAKLKDYQFIVSKVTSGPLAISTQEVA
jgi:hypothetical protein